VRDSIKSLTNEPLQATIRVIRLQILCIHSKHQTIFLFFFSSHLFIVHTLLLSLLSKLKEDNNKNRGFDRKKVGGRIERRTKRLCLIQWRIGCLQRNETEIVIQCIECIIECVCLINLVALFKMVHR
jgi:hypothetical protein